MSNETPRIAEQRVINGSFGRLYVDGTTIAEVSAVSLKAAIERENVKMAGTYEKGSKIKGISGTGTFKLKKVFTRFQEVWAALKLGKDVGFSLMTKLDDPDAYGAESFAAVGCKFTGDLPLIDWSVDALVEQEFSFEFRASDSDFGDRIVHPDMF